MDERIDALQKVVQSIQERNTRVAAEKAWERSFVRIGSILIATYSIACVVLYVIGNEHPILNALIPTVGYFLSTISLPLLKQSWIQRYISRTKNTEV